MRFLPLLLLPLIVGLCLVTPGHAALLGELPVDVDGTRQLLPVHSDDNPAAIAARFCNEHTLSSEHEAMLVREIESRYGKQLAQTKAANPSSVSRAPVQVPVIVEGQQLFVEMRPGDDLQEVSRQFCLKHGIDLEMQAAVVDIVKNHII